MFEIDYSKMLDRIDAIVAENGNEKSQIVCDLIDEICYCSGGPDLETAFDFCEYYGCSLDYLVGRV